MNTARTNAAWKARATGPVLLAVALGLAAAPARAQLSIKIDNPNQIIYQGQTALFTGTLTNTSATDTINITGSQVTDLFNGNYSNPSFIGGGAYFTSFAVVNATVVRYAPGQSYTGSLFYMASGGAPAGTYTGGSSTFILQGQDLTSSGYYYLPSPVNYSVTVLAGPPPAAPVPEPSSVAAFACTGLGAAGLMLRARKRAA